MLGYLCCLVALVGACTGSKLVRTNLPLFTVTRVGCVPGKAWTRLSRPYAWLKTCGQSARTSSQIKALAVRIGADPVVCLWVASLAWESDCERACRVRAVRCMSRVFLQLQDLPLQSSACDPAAPCQTDEHGTVRLSDFSGSLWCLGSELASLQGQVADD